MLVVAIGPGASAFTRIPGASSSAKVSVRLFTPAFAAEYGPFLRCPPKAARDERLMIAQSRRTYATGPHRLQIEIDLGIPLLR